MLHESYDGVPRRDTPLILWKGIQLDGRSVEQELIKHLPPCFAVH